MASNQYKGVKKILLRYWNAYGGWGSILRSPYLHISILITILSHATWRFTSWFELPISVLPNIIGFSLGGYAIWLALGDDKFRASISGKGTNGSESPFIRVNATFVHFIFLQILALVFALVAKAQPFHNLPLWLRKEMFSLSPCLVKSLSDLATSFGYFTGYLLFIYAIFTALAATMAIFRIAGWLEIHHVNQKKKQSKE